MDGIRLNKYIGFEPARIKVVRKSRDDFSYRKIGIKISDSEYTPNYHAMLRKELAMDNTESCINTEIALGILSRWIGKKVALLENLDNDEEIKLIDVEIKKLMSLRDKIYSNDLKTVDFVLKEHSKGLKSDESRDL